MKETREIEIDVKELFLVLINKLWVIILVGIIFTLGTFCISKFVIHPMYESSTGIYILNKQDANSSITYSDLQTGSQLTQDYMTLVTSRPVMEQVISQLDLKMKYEELVNLITVDNPTNTRILNITVNYEDPYKAKEIADAVREASAAHITEVMDIDKVNIVEEANVPDAPSSPNIVRNCIIGAILGIIIACFIILLVYFLDDTIKTPDDVEKYLGLSVLSSIPMQDNLKNGKLKMSNKKPKVKTQ